jgi:hypothetical protein
MTEILIVIGLIVLIIALAVPAFSFITGSRSVDAGENLVAAMLGRARAEAMSRNAVCGVAFFLDRSNDRSAMALVVPASLRSSSGGEPGGLEEYKSWKENEEDGTTKVQYKQGDVVIALVDMPPPNNGKKGTRLFVCREDHTANAATNRPPNNAAGSPAYTNQWWGALDDQEVDSLIGYEYQYLPPGVGAMTINDPDPTNTASGNPQRDRYLRGGLILFGGDGTLLHRKYVVGSPATTDTDQTHLFRIMGFHLRGAPLNQTDVGANVTYPIYSQLGVVLYDEENFRTAGGTPEDPLNDNGVVTAATPVNYNEVNEEKWLDNNSLSLMLNRYNGTLVRGE